MSVRPQRTPEPAPGAVPVAVTGGQSALGAALLARLGERLARPADGTAASLRGAATVVHLGDVDPAGTAALLEAARDAGVRRVVLVTGVEVHGASPDNAVPLAEDAPLAAVAEPGSRVAALLEVERLADHAARTGLDVVVLRPAPLVGAAAGADLDAAGGAAGAPALRRLAGSRLLALRGAEPLWQVCHVEDLVAALETAALGRVSGRRHVASTGWLEQWRVEAMAGRRRLELPPAVALSTAERLHRYGVVASSRAEVAALLGPLVVEATGLRAAGWTPTWTNEAALQAHLDAHVDADEAAPQVPATAREPSDARTVVAAASAATALVGTAALVRRARRARRRRA